MSVDSFESAIMGNLAVHQSSRQKIKPAEHEIVLKIKRLKLQEMGKRRDHYESID
jgi:hypothetical protein